MCLWDIIGYVLNEWVVKGFDNDFVRACDVEIGVDVVDVFGVRVFNSV